MAELTIYTVGGTVQANERGLYIPRQADEELLALCRDATFAYVLTPRQLGKSSLMIRTAEQLIEEGIQCVIIDISGVLGVNLTAEQWYKGLLDEIANQLILDTNVNQWWQEHTDLGVSQRLTLFFQNVLLVEVAASIVIFIDEIDTTLSLDFTDDFYAVIRYFHVARATNPEFRRLSFVLIGVATPGDLIRDPKRTPFNIGHRVDLTDFTFEEAQPLAVGLGLSTEIAQQVLRWVLKWTGGHPYLTQRLCRILADRTQADWSEAEVDRVVGSTFFGTASEQDNNLQFVRDMLTKRAPDIISVLTIYQQVWCDRHPVVDEEQSLIKSHLKLSGVVKREGKTLKIRNAIYREVFNNTWIRSHLPVNWAKRLQRAAVVLIGLILFSSVPFAVIGWNLAREAEKQRAIAEQQRQKAEEGAKRADQQRQIAQEQSKIAEQQRQKAEVAQKLAEAAKKKAEVAQQAEAKQRQLAEQLKVTADTARGLAEERRKQAEKAQEAEAKQRQLAEERRHQAETAQKAEAQQRQIAEGQREEANKAKLVQTLAGQALAFRDVFPQRSLLFAVESLNIGKNILRRTEAGALLRRLLGEIGGTPLVGHEKPVVTVAFSPKGDWLATGGKDGTVRLWDKLNPDKPAVILQGNTGEVKAVAISPNGKWLATAGQDRAVRLWDLSIPNPAVKPYLLQGHSGSINALSFSPDGHWLASGGEDPKDSTVRLWDITTVSPGKRSIVLKHPCQADKCTGKIITFSPHNRWLATAFFGNPYDYSVRLWDMTTLTSSATPILLKHEYLNEDRIWGLNFSPDERYLASADAYTLRLWDIGTGDQSNPPARILGTHNQYIFAVAFSPDGRKLATGSLDSTAKLWDMTTLNFSKPDAPIRSLTTLRGHAAVIGSIAFHPSGQWLATASQDGTARLWDITDLSIAPIVLQGHEGSVNTLTFDAKGQWLATASEDTQARLWKVPNVLNDPIVLTGIKDWVRANAISPNGKWIASADDDHIIRLWNTTELRRPPILLAGHTYDIYSLAFSPNGQWLVSANPDGTFLWDITNPSARPHTLTKSSSWSMAFSASGRWLAAGSYDGKVRLWNINSPNLPTEPKFVLDTQNLVGVRSLAFSRDERRLVTGGDAGFCSNRLALVWDLTKNNANTNPIPLIGHCDVVSDVAFSPDNRWVATAGWDGTARLWDLTSSNPSASAKIIKFNPVGRVVQVAFSPDGHWLAAGSWNYQVQLQDMNNLATKPQLLTGHQGRVFGVEFSPDNQWLATSSEDHTVRLWNPTDITAAPIVLRGHDAAVHPLAFSPDSRWLLSGSSDARLWRVHFSNDDLINIACRTAGRNLTPQEWQQAFDNQPYRKTCPE